MQLDWRQDLLAWYRCHGRDLPWRRDPQPYPVWLSEIMLQQTRIDQMLPYYGRFLERFPTVADLAAADLSEVLKQWEGLGYYSRARNLHRAAQQIARQGWPLDYAGWYRLPGVGPYTARAVTSVLYALAVGAVDGNIRRVYSRFFAEPRVLQTLADQRVDPQVPGDFNQALMDLGATVCTPRQPHCGSCPLAKNCQALAQNRIAEFPPVKTRKPLPERIFLVVVPLGSGGVWLTQRPARGLLGGLWELPNRAVQAAITAEQDYDGLIPQRRLGQVVHTYTHFRAVFEVWAGQGNEPWVPWSAVPSYPISRGFRRVLALMEGFDRPPPDGTAPCAVPLL